MNTGNAKALREVLETICDSIIVDGCMAKMSLSLFDISNITKSALLIPPRNCDIGTPEEQEERFNAYCMKIKMCELCRDCMNGYGAARSRCVIEWEQAPYESPKKG